MWGVSECPCIRAAAVTITNLEDAVIEMPARRSQMALPILGMDVLVAT